MDNGLLKEEGKLKDDTVVGTVMSNIGFHKAAEELGMKTVSNKPGSGDQQTDCGCIL